MDRLQRLGDRGPVLTASKGERRAQQVSDAGLRHRGRPGLPDGLGQTLEPVADEHADIVDATVLQLGQDLQPELRALAAVTGPDSEDLAAASTVTGKMGRLATLRSTVRNARRDRAGRRSRPL